MVIVQAGLGLRIAELLALRVEDVDFLRRVVRVEWQTTPDGKHRLPPKTPRSRRTLRCPLSSPTRSHSTSLRIHRIDTAWTADGLQMASDRA
jgi:integrase